MPDLNPNNIDPNVVVQKLQARLGEAMTVIAVLESQLEAATKASSQTAPERVTPEVFSDED